MKTILFKRGAKIEGPSGLAYQFTRDVESFAPVNKPGNISKVRIPVASLNALGGALDLSEVNNTRYVRGAPDWFWEVVKRAEYSCWSIVAHHKWVVDRKCVRRTLWQGQIA